MATTYVRISKDMQLSEATTVRRTVQYAHGAAEAQTYTVRKAGGGTTFGSPGAGGTITLVYGLVYELTPATGDLDTLGELTYKVTGPTSETVLYGLTVVTHDPYADLAAILDDTGTSGVILGSGAITSSRFAAGAIDATALGADAITSAKIADNALTPANFFSRVHYSPREIQQSEATTARRVIPVSLGTAEAVTPTVSKGGGALGVSSATCTQVDGTEYILTPTVGDIDTLGTIDYKLTGATSTTWLKGVQVVLHDPYTDLRFAAARAGIGLNVFDTSAGTNTVYNGADTATALGTQTRTTDGTKVLWTPDE